MAVSKQEFLENYAAASPLARAEFFKYFHTLPLMSDLANLQLKLILDGTDEVGNFETLLLLLPRVTFDIEIVEALSNAEIATGNRQFGRIAAMVEHASDQNRLESVWESILDLSSNVVLFELAQNGSVGEERLARLSRSHVPWVRREAIANPRRPFSVLENALTSSNFADLSGAADNPSATSEQRKALFELNLNEVNLALGLIAPEFEIQQGLLETIDFPYTLILNHKIDAELLPEVTDRALSISNNSLERIHYVTQVATNPYLDDEFSEVCRTTSQAIVRAAYASNIRNSEDNLLEIIQDEILRWGSPNDEVFVAAVQHQNAPALAITWLLDSDYRSVRTATRFSPKVTTKTLESGLAKPHPQRSSHRRHIADTESLAALYNISIRTDLFSWGAPTPSPTPSLTPDSTNQLWTLPGNTYPPQGRGPSI